jgi:3-deoxy-7-phosphoheptulonate synthase
LHRVSEALDLPVVSEVMAPHQLEDVHPFVDVLQVGMRNSLNYPLLTAIGEHPKRPPVLLKCGIGTSLDEFLCAADYILAGGNPNVILCLRGRVGLSEYTRSALNINDVPVLRRLTHLPIVVDPSHAAGRRDIVPAMSAAALASGADGLLVEVHNRPEVALCDGSQSLTLAGFERMMHRLRQLARGMGRTMTNNLGSTASGGNHPYEDLDLEAPSTHLGECDEDGE